MEYGIGEFSKRTHLGIHTLRYYEQEGLLKPRRNAANRRCYTEADQQWADFIKRLKETGMPIREIKAYARLREAGDETIPERIALLIRHRQALKEQIALLEAHQRNLDQKIAFYRSETARLQAKPPVP